MHIIQLIEALGFIAGILLLSLLFLAGFMLLIKKGNH